MAGLTLIESTTHFSGEILKYLLSDKIETRFSGLYVEQITQSNGAVSLRTSVDWESWANNVEYTRYKAIELIFCFWAFLHNNNSEILEFFNQETRLNVQMITALGYYCKLPEYDPYLETINIARKALRKMREVVNVNNETQCHKVQKIFNRFSILRGWDRIYLS